MTQHFLIRPDAGAIIISNSQSRSHSTSSTASTKQNSNFCRKTNNIWNIIKLLLFRQIACLQFFLINLISRTKELGFFLCSRQEEPKSSLTLGRSSVCGCCLLPLYSQARRGASIGLLGPFGCTLFMSWLFRCRHRHLQFKGTRANTVIMYVGAAADQIEWLPGGRNDF